MIIAFPLAKVVFYLVKSNIAPAFLWNSNISEVKIRHKKISRPTKVNFVILCINSFQLRYFLLILRYNN